MPLNHSSKYAELTSDQFELIGRLVVELSNTEFLLAVVLNRLLKTPDFFGRVYTDEMTLSRIQAAILKALNIHIYMYGYKILSESVIDEIKSINIEIDTLRNLRNRFAHYCWFRISDNQISGTSFSGVVHQPQKQDKDFASITVDELSEAYNCAYNLVERISALIKILPEAKP